MDLTAVLLRMYGSISVYNYISNQSNVASSFSALRNISAGTTAPSGGLTGEIYIQY
jgi:hypothetical protein